MTTSLRYAMRTILVVVVLFVVVISALTLFSPGRTVLASLISSIASSPEQQINIAGISGIWSGDLSIEKIDISDDLGHWFSAQQARLKWSPSSLLVGHFNASSIAVETITLERLPQSGKQPETGGSTTIPFTVEVQSFEIAKLIVPKSIAGKQSNLRVSAAAKLDIKPMDVQAKIRIESLDDQLEILNLIAAFQPHNERAEINLSIREPPDGIIANLLQFEGGPSFDLQLAGAGPLTNWQLQIAGAMNNQQVMKATGNIVATENTQRIRLVGTAEAAKLLPPQYRPLVGNIVDMDVDITRSSSGKIDVKKAKIGADQFFVSAKGIFDPQGTNAISGGFSSRDAALNITNGIVAGLPNFAPHSLAFTITGSGSEATIEATADIPLVDTGELQLLGLKSHLISPGFDLQNLEGTFTTKTSIASILSPNANLKRIVEGEQYLEAKGSLNSQRLDLESINASNSGLVVGGSAQYLLDEKKWDATFKTSLAPTAMPPSLSRLIGEPLELKGKANGNSTGTIYAEIASLKGGPMIASGTASVDRGKIDSAFKVAFSTISGLVEGLDMTVNTELSASGPLDAPNVDLTISGDDLVFNKHTGKDLELTIRGTANPQTPDMQLTLTGELDDQSIKGGTRLYVKEGMRVLEGLRFESGENSIEGELVFDDEFVPVGSINLDLPNLNTLAALALQELSGSATGTIKFANSSQTPTMDMQLTSNEIKRSDLTVSGTNVEISATDYLAEPKLSGQIAIGSLLSGTTFVANTSIDLSQQGEWTQFNLNTNANKIPFSANGRVKAGGNVVVEIDEARATVENVPVRLARPASVKVSGGTAVIEALDLNLGDGHIAVKGSAGQTLDIGIEITSLNASIANQFVPDLGAGGSLSGRATLSGNSSAPVIDFDMRLANGNIKQTRELGIAGLNVLSNGSFQDNTLSLKTKTTNAQGLAISGGGSIGLKGAPKLNLAFDGKVPFPLLARQLSDQGIVLQGSSNVSINITGSAGNPRIAGRIASKDGRFVHAESGIAINALALEMTMAEEQIRIQKLAGELSTGGRIDASGNIGIAPNSSFPANIKVNIRDGVYTDHQSVSSKFDANLALKGPLVADPVASGTISLKRTTVTIPARIPSSISGLDVQHKNATTEISRQADGLKPAKTEAKSGMRLAMDILANNQIFVRGRGLDAELGGNLKLTNSISNPQALGAFNIRRGRLSILGKRLDFKRGQMNFAGSLVPELDVTAETERDQYTIAINVVGPADNPEFRFSSSPALAEDEVLAMLVFGKDLGSLSALQIVKLGQAVATLTGKGGNSSLLDKFQKLIKVDDLDVKTDSETGETTVGAGRYINDKTYVGVERGSGAGTGKATIDLTIGKGVKLRGEAGEDGQNKAGIFYEKEY